MLERPDLNYADYLSLKTNVSLVSMDLTTGESKGAVKAAGFAFSVFMLTFQTEKGMHVCVASSKKSPIASLRWCSAIRPGLLLAGKIAGIGLVGLTQIAGWSSCLVLFEPWHDRGAECVDGIVDGFARLDCRRDCHGGGRTRRRPFC